MENIECPKLVIFDLYGTLIKFGVMHHPFRQLFKWARENGRPVRPDDARQLMTIDGDIFFLAKQLNISAPNDYLIDLQNLIEEELESLSLFDDVITTLNKLESLNIQVAICSNLAKPYGAVINKLLSSFKLKLFLSYEVGFIKPETGIYQKILDQTGLTANQCLFVGDTFAADYEGPNRYGFQALHLIREALPTDYVIGNLTDIIKMFETQ